MSLAFRPDAGDRLCLVVPRMDYDWPENKVRIG